MDKIEKEKYENQIKVLNIEIPPSLSPLSSPELKRRNSNKQILKEKSFDKKISKIIKVNELELFTLVEKEKEKEKNNFKNKKRLTIVDSVKCDNNDQKLDNTLIEIYNKKRMSYIPVKNIEGDDYEFGTQRINIKIDGDNIRGIEYNIKLFKIIIKNFKKLVKIGNGYILLEKYIEVFGPNEEKIMINSLMPNSKN
jgi:hypothetical protein